MGLIATTGPWKSWEDILFALLMPVIALVVLPLAYFLVLGIIPSAISRSLDKHETTKRIVTNIFKIAVNLLFVCIFLFIVASGKEWQKVVDFLKIIFFVVGFITCWVLINRAMGVRLPSTPKPETETETETKPTYQGNGLGPIIGWIVGAILIYILFYFLSVH